MWATGAYSLFKVTAPLLNRLTPALAVAAALPDGVMHYRHRVGTALETIMVKCQRTFDVAQTPFRAGDIGRTSPNRLRASHFGHQ